MRKLVIAGFCLALAASSARAADLREPYPEPYGSPPHAYEPQPRAYGPPPDPDDEPPVHRREPPHAFVPPPVHGDRGEGGPPPWREGGWREGGRRDGYWREGRWHRHHHHDDGGCWVRPTPWGPERICR